jgi:membrane complex biogenesis BtpA family protein
MDVLERTFAVRKPVIAMLHLPGLPGRPWHDRASGMDAAVDCVGRDLAVLQDAGVDGVLFCNGRTPVPAAGRSRDRGGDGVGRRPAEARRARAVRVNLLWDAIASLAVARAPGHASCAMMTGVYESDLGMIEPHIGDIGGFRTAIGADDVLLFDNIAPEFASAIGKRTIAQRARGAAFLGVDAILISGPAAGTSFEMSDLRAAKEAVPEMAVIANTGVRAERIAEIFTVADGAIVGTSLKRDGVTWNEVDPDRARALVDAAGVARAALGAG